MGSGGETLIKDILVSFKVDIVIVQETKKAKVDRPLCMKFCVLEVRTGRTFEQLELVVYIDWKYNVVEMLHHRKGQYSIFIKF